MNTIKQIEETANNLVPLYAQEEHDLPDRPLWSHPEIDQVIEALRLLSDVLFPGRHIPEPVDFRSFFIKQLKNTSEILEQEIEKALPFRWMGAADLHEKRLPIDNLFLASTELVNTFLQKIPEIRTMLIEDVKAAYNGDPAALSYAEVKLAYPGLVAITSHRIAHELYKLDIPLIPRIMSEYTHSLTGIDIHPGATIGKGFFIDHGTGVVIGETCHIGNQVKLYQGVTLGAKSFPLDEHGRPIKHIQRHPTVEDNVIVYANSTILGGDTVIGQGSTVAGNVFLMKSTPPRSLVTRSEEGIIIRTREVHGHGMGI
ncbi:Serine acetyltransferase [Pontiella desulfatans]|uniref:Serine acetyltransferase n=1 Tax=Pontiella desulfatans TaxID=2750659 RepID=A0A6C2U5J0_PONDE|nr:serine O-acetyltransferase EpsC [Pontiella desulfatans]VGO15175.1 Serine acetyltransferase [Pontiella desulfatans]